MTAIAPAAASAQARDPRPAPRRRADRAWTLGGAALVVAGCVLLEARPVLVAASPAPALTLVALFVVLLVVGAWWPVPAIAGTASSSTGRATTAAVVAMGVIAFAVGRFVGGGHPAVPATAFLVLTNTLAAVAEEAFFRRLCFGLLAPAGVAWAVAGSALLFAVVHVTTYGLWVLPLDLAAGLIFGWQRATTGSWRAPAITHVLVNLMVVL
jgi:membrane protease YdiL (CAAX protease family)